jgi:hypothetical protein
MLFAFHWVYLKHLSNSLTLRCQNAH